MISSCLRALLRPAVGFCLRHNVPVQDLVEIAKDLMVKLSSEDLGVDSGKVTVSRLSLITGIRRREVQRLLKGYTNATRESTSTSVLTRVISKWSNDPRFSAERGIPKPLLSKGRNSDYNRLVKSVTSDVSPGTVLLELIRIGAVKLEAGTVHFVKPPTQLDNNVIEGYKLLASDVSELRMAVEQNLFNSSASPNHHSSTEFHNIAESKIELVRRWIARECAALHQRARDFFAKCDKDLNPELKGRGGGRVVVSSFSRVIEPPQVTVQVREPEPEKPRHNGKDNEKVPQTFFG